MQIPKSIYLSAHTQKKIKYPKTSFDGISFNRFTDGKLDKIYILGSFSLNHRVIYLNKKKRVKLIESAITHRI